MASKIHNEQTALRFMTDLAAKFQAASPEHRQIIANHLLESMARDTIMHMEGPSYLVSAFNEDLAEDLGELA